VRSDLRDLLRREFRWTDPEPAGSYLVSDRSGWWRTPEVLSGLGSALGELFADDRPTVVVSPEVTGFLVGPLVAQALRIGFVEAYKLGIAGGRRPIAEPMTWADVPADHRGDRQRLGVRSRHIGPGDRVLVVDDWAVTGVQARALYAVVAELGASPIGTAVIVSECAPPVAAELRIRGLLTGADL
jgi:adenine phosphoribosyltransferase